MSPTPPPFSEQASTAIGLERFYAALADIGDLVATMPEPQALYTETVRIFEHHVGALLVLAGEIDYAAGVLHRRAPSTPPEGREDIYPESVRLALAPPEFWQGHIAVDGNIADAPGREFLRPGYARHGIRASAAVPISCSGKVHSALILRARDPAFFDPTMLHLLARAALSMGHALEGDAQRQRLDQALLAAERSRRSLRLLSEMLKVAMHADTEADLFSQACRIVVDEGGYAVCWMGMLEDHSTQALSLRTHAGRGAESYQSLRLNLDDESMSCSVAATVARLGEPVMKLPSDAGDDNWAIHARSLALGALLGLPLRLHGEVIGVIVIGADLEDAFPAVETAVFAEMAQELSMGLERLRARQAQNVAEKQLDLNLRRFQAILGSRYAGVLVLDADERVQFCNDTLCRMFDLAEAPEQLLGLSAICIDETTRGAYANPERELARILHILQKNEPVDVEEVAITHGRTYLRSFTPILIDGQRHGRVWHLIDITEHRTQEATIARLAYYDSVTGLPNRRLFFELLDHGRGRANRSQGLLAIGILDLDGFKQVNDDLGHLIGDKVFTELARRIQCDLREGDVVARIGSGEFAFMLMELDHERELRGLSARLLESVRQPIMVDGEAIRLSASLGWTLCPGDDADAEALMRHAAIAMNKAKEQGRDRDQIYSAALERESMEQRVMQSRVASAVDGDGDGELVLLFQPIVAADAGTGTFRVVGAEALLRLRDEALGLLPPALFHSSLDDIVLARPIGRHVLRAALRATEGWLALGVRLPVAVNISTRHLMHPHFMDDLREALAAHPRVEVALLGIEITETGPLLDPVRARMVIDACRALGVEVSLDDFGTGSASLSHIQQMAADTLKIDQSFVRDILLDSRNTAIAAGIITTAQLLGIGVIAEGVETVEQGALLLALGCHQLQGHVISRPMAAEAVPAWLDTWGPPDAWLSEKKL